MPTSRPVTSFEFPGYSFNDNPSNVSFVTTVATEQTMTALNSSQTGTLSTRTDDDTGVCTLSSGHGLSDGKVDVYWSGGVRYGMDGTVSGTEVTVDGGAGDNLPVVSTAVTVTAQTSIEVNFDGDDAQIIAVTYRNSSDTAAAAHVDFQDAGDATIQEVDVVHETANGGCDQIWNISAGDTNDFSGNRVTEALASHDSEYAATLYILVGLTAA